MDTRNSINSREANIAYEDALLRAGFSLAILSELGFEPATLSQIPKKITEISPIGSTAMRDAVIEGITLLLQLNTILIQLGTGNVWNFVHIVITDGDDTCSKTSVEQTCELLKLINCTIPEQMLKTWFIGIDLNQHGVAAQNMLKFCKTGQKNTEFMNITDLEIGSIFEKIILKLGIQQNTGLIGIHNQDSNQVNLLAFTEQKVGVSITEQRFVVLFNLDFSSSMSGSKWTQVCNSVERFVKYLGKDDLVAAVIFNDKVQKVTSDGIRLSLPISENKRSYVPPQPKNIVIPDYSKNPSSMLFYDNDRFQQKKNKCLDIFVYIWFGILVVAAVVEVLSELGVFYISF